MRDIPKICKKDSKFFLDIYKTKYLLLILLREWMCKSLKKIKFYEAEMLTWFLI